MKYWLKSNQFWLVALTGLIVGISNYWLDNIMLLLPATQVQMLFAPAPIYIAMGIVPAIWLGLYMDGNRNLTWATARRSTRMLDGMFLCGALLPLAAAVIVLYCLKVNSLGCLQDSLLFVGLVLIGHRLVPNGYATAWPIIWIFGASLLGRTHLDGYFGSQAWAFILDSMPTSDGWIISTVVFVLGLLLISNSQRLWFPKLTATTKLFKNIN